MIEKLQQQEEAEEEWLYRPTAKLRRAENKAGRDFRSDVVTVPTESMMQVMITPFPQQVIYTDQSGPGNCGRLGQ